MTPSIFVKRVREISAKSENVEITYHALDRMEERDIADIHVFEVLEAGSLMGGVSVGMRAGEWTGKLVKRIKGRREVGVATVVMQNGKLKVITVEWEDLK